MGNESRSERLRRVRTQHAADQNYLCFYCNDPLNMDYESCDPKRVTLDHKTPKCDGGMNTIENTCASCYECNQRKGDMDVEVFLRYLCPTR